MGLAAWRKIELRSFQHHPLLSYAAGYAGELPSKLQSPKRACTPAWAREGLPQVRACSFALQHLHFCVKIFCDDYIFAAQAPIFAYLKRVITHLMIWKLHCNISKPHC